MRLISLLIVPALLILCISLSAAEKSPAPAKKEAEKELFSDERNSEITGERAPAQIDPLVAIPLYEPKGFELCEPKTPPVVDASWADFYAGCGYFIPVSKYADRYNAALKYSAGAEITALTFYGLCPCIEAGYTSIKTKPSDDLVNAKMDLFSFCGGVGYRKSFSLPDFIISQGLLRNLWVFSARALYGATQVSFTSDMQKTPCVEIISTARIELSLSYEVYRSFEVGLAGSAERVFTSGVPLDAACVTGFIGYRF